MEGDSLEGEVDRRAFIAGLSALGMGSIAGCNTASRKMTENTVDTESESSQYNRKVEKFGWPPSVPKKPDRDNFNEWQQEIWLYTWMAAVHTEQLNTKMDEQNKLLEEIRDELRK